MRRADARKSPAHAALWECLKALRGTDGRVLQARLEFLETELDRLAWERDNLRQEADPKAFASLQEQLGQAEAAAAAAKQRAAQEAAALKRAVEDVESARARCRRLEELLEVLGVSGFTLEHAVACASPEQVLRAALSPKWA